MHNSIKVFSGQDFTVRTFTDENGVVWFVGKDVAEALGYKDTRSAIRDHVDPEDKRALSNSSEGQNAAPLNGGYGDMPILINESGLYSLILSSKLPVAKKYKHWVTSEVLPQIHKTGSYSLPSVARAIQVDKKDKLPAHSGGIKAGERLAAKVFKCKKPEDFQAVIAMDEDFRDAFGYSWLERHGFRLVKKMVPTTWEERSETGLWMWDKKEAFAWEHDYDLDKITEKNSTNDYDIYPF